MSELHVNGRPVPYETVPVDYMAGAVKRYFENGIEPGSFLAALLCNDLCETIARADDTNGANLTHWVRWLYNNAPSSSWGSRANYKRWIETCQETAS